MTINRCITARDARIIVEFGALDMVYGDANTDTLEQSRVYDRLHTSLIDNIPTRARIIRAVEILKDHKILESNNQYLIYRI